ncbi:hypothetical protein ABVT39_006593, partial [Epinephelus coioides]
SELTARGYVSYHLKMVSCTGKLCSVTASRHYRGFWVKSFSQVRSDAHFRKGCIKGTGLHPLITTEDNLVTLRTCAP